MTSQPTAYQLLILARMGFSADKVAAMTAEEWKNYLRHYARVMQDWALHGAPAGDLSFVQGL